MGYYKILVLLKLLQGKKQMPNMEFNRKYF